MDLVDTIITVHQRRNNRMKWYYYERSQNKQPSVTLSHTCRLKPFSDYCEINQGLFTVLYSHLTSHPTLSPNLSLRRNTVHYLYTAQYINVL